ncbi:MAG: hypothetical protein NTX00_01280 [Candidatus Parcubacteria bacterium]|nr:hypothetical protein [Candidatus Parcubacteria bacterium]
MKKISKNLKMKLLGIIALVAGLLLIWQTIHVFRIPAEKFLEPIPRPYEINLQNFGGRIFSPEKLISFPPLILRGLFFSAKIFPSVTIKVPFSEAMSWGKEAILIYDVTEVPAGNNCCAGNLVKISILRPDPITPNIFQFAENEINPWGDGHYEIRQIILKDKTLVVLPKVESHANPKVFTIALNIVALIMSIGLGLLFLIVGFKEEKNE